MSFFSLLVDVCATLPKMNLEVDGIGYLLSANTQAVQRWSE